MSFKVGDKVKVKPSENDVWGDGSACEVKCIYDTGVVSVTHPKYGRGAFYPSGLELAHPFQIGDKVRCTLSSEDGNPHWVCTAFFGKTGTVVEDSDYLTTDDEKARWSAKSCVIVEFDEGEDCDYKCNWVHVDDLQYVFQEGDIVKLTCSCHAGGVTGVVEKAGEVETYVNVDGSKANALSCLTKNLELIDRAPKSDAEQCCNADDGVKENPSMYSVGDRVKVVCTKPSYSTGAVGTILNFTDFCKIPHVRVKLDNGEEGLYEYDEIELDVNGFFKAKTEEEPFCFPVDEPGDYSLKYGFEAEFTDGESLKYRYDAVVCVLKLHNGDLELQMNDDCYVTFPAATLKSYCVPGDKWARMVTLGGAA